MAEADGGFVLGTHVCQEEVQYHKTHFAQASEITRQGQLVTDSSPE